MDDTSQGALFLRGRWRTVVGETADTLATLVTETLSDASVKTLQLVADPKVAPPNRLAAVVINGRTGSMLPVGVDDGGNGLLYVLDQVLTVEGRSADGVAGMLHNALEHQNVTSVDVTGPVTTDELTKDTYAFTTVTVDGRSGQLSPTGVLNHGSGDGPASIELPAGAEATVGG